MTRQQVHGANFVQIKHRSPNWNRVIFITGEAVSCTSKKSSIIHIQGGKMNQIMSVAVEPRISDGYIEWHSIPPLFFFTTAAFRKDPQMLLGISFGISDRSWRIRTECTETPNMDKRKDSIWINFCILKYIRFINHTVQAHFEQSR